METIANDIQPAIKQETGKDKKEFDEGERAIMKAMGLLDEGKKEAKKDGK